MAKFEIKKSEMEVRGSKPINVTALAMSPSFYAQIGSNISQAGAVYDKIKKDQKAIEDQNRFYDLIIPRQKLIDNVLANASKNTTLMLAEEEMETAYDIDVSNENKQVQSLVNTYINKQRIKNNSLLYKAVLSNSAQKTSLNDAEFLQNNLLDRTNSDPGVRAAGDKDFTDWFDNPVNKMKSSPKEHQKKMDQWNYLKNETLINLSIKNNPLDVMLSRDEIIEKYGLQYGSLYLAKAQNKFVSDAQEEMMRNDKEVTERSKNQITIFTEYGNRILDDKDRPTIDELHDAKDNGDLNSAQYNALIDLFLNPDKVSDADFINRINNQIVIADNVNELEDLQNTYSSSKDFLESTTIKDTAILSKLINSFKDDPTKHEDYKSYYRRLKINLGDLEGIGDILFGSGGITTEDKEETQDAVSRFNRYVVQDGLSPEEAYLRTISKVSQNKLPDIYSPNLVPLNFSMENMADAIKKEPTKFFDNINDELAIKFKSGDITRSEFLEDISRVDLLKDVFEVRKKIGGVDFAAAKTENQALDLNSLIKLFGDNKD
tara:strand:- start:6102 stop:7739 length:1638 start_codon:yes stop_codon:yes gene_type:complete